MTDRPPTPGATQADLEARMAALAARSTKRRRHPAQGARIAAAGLGTTTMLGLVGAFAFTQPPAPSSSGSPAAAQPRVVVVVHQTGAVDGTVGGAVAPIDPLAADPVTTPPTARPSVRPAPPATQAPAASTHGSH